MWADKYSYGLSDYRQKSADVQTELTGRRSSPRSERSSPPNWLQQSRLIEHNAYKYDLTNSTNSTASLRRLRDEIQTATTIIRYRCRLKLVFDNVAYYHSISKVLKLHVENKIQSMYAQTCNARACIYLTRTATRSCRTRKRTFHFYSPGVVGRSHTAALHVQARATALLPLLQLLRLLLMLLCNVYSQFAD